MNPKLKPPGTKRLKLNWDILLSTSAFKFNLRRYTVVAAPVEEEPVLMAAVPEPTAAFEPQPSEPEVPEPVAAPEPVVSEPVAPEPVVAEEVAMEAAATEAVVPETEVVEVEPSGYCSPLHSMHFEPWPPEIKGTP
jgi:hypothetical protein